MRNVPLASLVRDISISRSEALGAFPQVCFSCEKGLKDPSQKIGGYCDFVLELEDAAF